MTEASEFGAKLDLALRLLNISRGRLAAEAQVDKSLVSRWARGLTAPRGHNLAVLTDIVRQRRPDFTQLTWDLPLDAFGKAMGGEVSAVEPAPPPPAASAEPSPGDLTVSREQSAVEVAREGHAYPGLYIGFRQAFRNTGQIIADVVFIWREGDRLFFRQFDPAFTHTGELLILRHQLFLVGEDDRRADGLMYFLLNGVTGQKAVRLDGLFITVLNDRHRTPGAAPIVFQRLDDLADPGRPPDEATLIPIVERMATLFRAGAIEALAGEDILASISPVIGAPKPGGGLDRLLRRPGEASLSATEMDWTPALHDHVQSLRRAILDRDDVFPMFEPDQGPVVAWRPEIGRGETGRGD